MKATNKAKFLEMAGNHWEAIAPLIKEATEAMFQNETELQCADLFKIRDAIKAKCKGREAYARYKDFSGYCEARLRAYNKSVMGGVI